ncbi:hypothetical protein ccbrp13_50790 [Ktedonobacteria bacterium brp13]|nr:hypothetical protein ccbrp13_50790 [Ktedonobacteria bacterium brp13]
MMDEKSQVGQVGRLDMMDMMDVLAALACPDYASLALKVVFAGPLDPPIA